MFLYTQNQFINCNLIIELLKKEFKFQALLFLNE